MRLPLVGLLLLLLLAPPASAADGGHWVAGWAASPSDASPTTPALSEETVRMIIHPTFGGSRVRLRLSNRFGDAPVTLGAATIARRDSGSAVVASSIRPVTFRGSRQVQIGRGAEVVSDPVDLTFSAFDDLAVSVYVSGTAPATGRWPRPSTSQRSGRPPRRPRRSPRRRAVHPPPRLSRLPRSARARDGLSCSSPGATRAGSAPRAVLRAGRRLATCVRGRTRARIPVRGLPTGRARSRLLIRLRDGRTISRSHRYRTCAASR